MTLFESFLDQHGKLSPHRTEWRVFDEAYQIAGTIDLIARNGSDFIMYDWKRSKKVVSIKGDPIVNNNFGRTGIGLLSHIDDTTYNHYCIQQNMYKFILENNYGIEIKKMNLLILHKEYDGYFLVEVPNMGSEVELILNAISDDF